MQDEQIVALYFARDERAIAESDAKYGPYCRQIAYNIVRSDPDAQECVNDTWLRSWNAIPPSRPALLKAFFAKIARNLALDRYKTLSAQRRGGGELPLILSELSECVSGAESVETQADRHALEQALNRFLRALPRREADIFIRRCFYAESLGTIARRYRMSENHAAVILSRCRKKLRAALEKEGFEP